MWTVTSQNGFLPLLQPVHGWGQFITNVGVEPGEDADRAPARGTDASFCHIRAISAIDQLVTTLPTLAADVSNPTAIIDAVMKNLAMEECLNVDALLRDLSMVDGAPVALAGLASLPRPVLLHGLFRDLSLLSSAVIHEPRAKALRACAPWEDDLGTSPCAGVGAGEGWKGEGRERHVDLAAARADAASARAMPRDTLPACLAVPILALSRLTGLPPILEYTSYCLGSHCSAAQDTRPRQRLTGLPPKLKGDLVCAPALPSVPSPAPGSAASYAHATWRWSTLRMCRAIDGGTNEAAFILMHGEIEAHGPALVRAVQAIVQDGLGLTLLSMPTATSPNAGALGAGLASLDACMRSIIVSQLKMFNACDPRVYEARTRPWIFGWKGNPDLPAGVVYEGISEAQVREAGWGRAVVQAGQVGESGPGVRLALRGETGAQSSIVPTLDILLGVTHKGDALKGMLEDLEAYRPRGHREWLCSLRGAMWDDVCVAAGSAPGGRTGSRGFRAALAPAQEGVGVEEEEEDEAPHALRDYIRSSHDRALVRAFNAVVQSAWAFRAVHVAYSDLYIARVTAKECATGGTPYKAYLRKHRDETRAHQLWDGPGGAEDCVLTLPYTPASHEEFCDEVEAVLAEGGGEGKRNAIPAHLLARHAADIALYGGGDPSLSCRCW